MDTLVSGLNVCTDLQKTKSNPERLILELVRDDHERTRWVVRWPGTDRRLISLAQPCTRNGWLSAAWAAAESGRRTNSLSTACVLGELHSPHGAFTCRDLALLACVDHRQRCMVASSQFYTDQFTIQNNS
jgi:hypothetical protein